MNTRLLTLAVACACILCACHKESFLSEQNQKKTITLSTTMPQGSSETKMALIQNGRNIQLRWEDNDQLQLCLVQGALKVKQVVSVKNISEDRKRAEFDLTIPESFSTGTFELYGLYGGQLSDTNLTEAILPLLPNESSLSGIQNRKATVLSFHQDSISTEHPSISVPLKHMGSLFCIKIKNAGGASLTNLGSIQLAASGNGWAFNNIGGGDHFNLSNGTFISETISGTNLPFPLNSTSIASGDTLTVWGWFPCVETTLWPELQLKMYDNSASLIATSTNSKPARNNYTLNGKAYYFYALWNGSTLSFTDTTLSPPPSIEDLTLNGDLLDCEAGNDFLGMVYARSGNIYYNAAKSNGSWDGEVLLGAGSEARLRIDRNQRPHIVYTTSDSKIAYHRFDGTSWLTAMYVESNFGGGCSKPDLDLDKQANAYLTYTDSKGTSDESYADIMYADNTSGTFTKSVLYDGDYVSYGGADAYAEYFNKGSKIAVDSLGNYTIITHQYILMKSMGWTDRLYGLIAKDKSGLSAGTTQTSSDQSDLYELKTSTNGVIGLIRESNQNKTILISPGTTALNISNHTNVTTSSTVVSLSLNGSEQLIGGHASSVLFTKYGTTETTHSGTIVRNTSVNFTNIGNTRYAVYTDNADGKIRIKKVP